MYNIALCDDDLLDLDLLKTKVEKILNYNKIPYSILEYTNLIQVREDIINKNIIYDLLLFDILLGDENTITFIKELRKNNIYVPVIYCTNYDNFAISAIEAQVFGYLLKPINYEKLEELLLNRYKNLFKIKYINITSNGELRKIPFDSIQYIEIQGRRSKIVTLSESFLVSDTLASLMETLPAQLFYRCHYSYVVNISHISSVVRYTITLLSNQNIPISKSRYNDTKLALMEFLSSNNS